MVVAMMIMSACKPDSAESVEYKVGTENLTFEGAGGTQEFFVRTTADVTAVGNAAWITVSQDNAYSSDKIRKFVVNASANDTDAERTAAINVTVAGKFNETIAVVQKVKPAEPEKPVEPEKPEEPEFPSTPIDPDKTGMDSDAKTLMKKMDMGINLGNTLEATGGETAWGAPRTTEEMIKYFKELGFNAVRIPCSWDQYLEKGDGYVVKDTWMKRVKEVVDYVVNNDMYAVLNVHWDGGWLENDIPNGYNEAVNEQQRAIWTQIAYAFRDYDEHLLFAGTNEPNAKNAADMEVLLRYEQTFIDAVRATGGRNAYRVLVFQGPSTDIDHTVDLMKTLPEDKVAGRLAAEVHYYTPSTFCILSEDADWGKCDYFWGEDQKGYATGAYAGRWSTWGDEKALAGQMAKMKKKKFWDNGYPVIIGEYGASSGKKFNLSDDEAENAKAKEGYDKSHAAFSACVVKEAKANGCVPFYWHCEGDLLDRSERRLTQPLTYEAMLEASKTQYPN